MRGKQAPKRTHKPDPKYNNEVIGKFINLMMERGKKLTAQRIMYDAFSMIEKKSKKDPLQVFETAMANVSPVLEVKSRRVGGANYQVPVEVKGERKNLLAMRWVIAASRSRKGRAMSEKLADELIAAAEKQGEAMKKREDVHRMAEANRAFAHFAR